MRLPFSHKLHALLFAAATSMVPVLEAAEWQLTWKTSGSASAPKATLCPLKFGKHWAYTVEIDDGPASTLAVSMPLLAEFQFTDAPPGVPGGVPRPFVGSAAAFPLRIGSGNPEFLGWPGLRTLQSNGWAVANHGYAHIGNHWEKGGGLTDDEIRNELFWSQTVFAAESTTGRSPAHFVYPNGYTNYASRLAEFGLFSASRVGGSGRNMSGALSAPLDLDRNYLDEAVWMHSGNPLAGLPAVPVAGGIVVDFTHGMSGDKNSPNHRRWRERLGHIASRHGRSGADDVWSAPTQEIVEYILTARSARIRCEPGMLNVSTPAESPGSPLTIRLDGISDGDVLPVPAGGVVYRRGNQAWITTPRLGLAGTPPPKPSVRRSHTGPPRSITFPRPVRVAGLRLLQRGDPAGQPALQIRILRADGSVFEVAANSPQPAWGAWRLYPIAPIKPSVMATGLEVVAGPAFAEIEVWEEVD